METSPGSVLPPLKPVLGRIKPLHLPALLALHPSEVAVPTRSGHWSCYTLSLALLLLYRQEWLLQGLRVSRADDASPYAAVSFNKIKT